MVMKKCVICNKLYQATTNSKTCSLECKQIRNRQVNTRGHKKNYYDNLIQDALIGYRAENLDRDIQKAKSMGISYGKYKAMQYMFRMKAEEVANA